MEQREYGNSSCKEYAYNPSNKWNLKNEDFYELDSVEDGSSFDDTQWFERIAKELKWLLKSVVGSKKEVSDPLDLPRERI